MVINCDDARHDVAVSRDIIHYDSTETDNTACKTGDVLIGYISTVRWLNFSSPSIFVDHFLSRLITICHICHNLRLLGQQRAAFIRMTCSDAQK